MIKRLISGQAGNFLSKLLKSTMTISQPTAGVHKHKAVPKKAYEILLQNNLDNSIKLPSQGVLKSLRSRGIARIMASNHNLYDTDEVLEVHVECLSALVHRTELPIDAIAMFVEKIYMEIDNLRQEEITAPSLLNLLKPTILTKIVRISQGIEAFYNESFRGLISAVIVKLLEKSVANQIKHQAAIKALNEEMEQIKKGSKKVDLEGNIINAQQLGGWHSNKVKEIDQNYRYTNEVDYWNGFLHVIAMQYYTDSFLTNNIIRLEKSLEKDIRTFSINELIIKIKCIVELQKFKSLKIVGERGLRALLFSYNKMVQQYFKILSAQSNIFQLLNNDDAIIQTQLLTNFLTTEHYQRAKKVYLDIFKVVLNISSNGALLIDVKRIRGIFQVILILYTHEDTKEVHALLNQLEKVMNIYPLDKFEKFQAHCYVCEKYGYKSDFFAEKFFNNLLVQRQKLQRVKGQIHHVHQVTRELLLAKKFLVYTKVTNKPSKEQVQTTSKIINSLFDPNIWFCLNENEPVFDTFLTASSFAYNIYFQRVGIKNLMHGGYQRNKIQAMITQINLKNLSKHYSQIQEDLKGFNNHKNNSKLDHISGWRFNSHARMKTILQLANFNYEYLKKNNVQQANNFIEIFFKKSLGSPIFYNSLKQKFAYPEILDHYIELMEKSSSKSFSVQTRDLQSIKRMYQSHLQKIMKPSERPAFSYLYQDHLDFIELNRVNIPYNQDVYGLSNIVNCAALSLFHQAMKRFEKQKEYVKMQIQTFMKFNKTGQISVITNFMEFPNLADIKVSYKDEAMIILFRNFQGDLSNFLNYKQMNMQKQSENYWRKKGYQVHIFKSDKDIDEFMKKITRIAAKNDK